MILGISLVVQELNKGPRLVFRYPEEDSSYYHRNFQSVVCASSKSKSAKALKLPAGGVTPSSSHEKTSQKVSILTPHDRQESEERKEDHTTDPTPSNINAAHTTTPSKPVSSFSGNDVDTTAYCSAAIRLNKIYKQYFGLSDENYAKLFRQKNALMGKVLDFSIDDLHFIALPCTCPLADEIVSINTNNSNSNSSSLLATPTNASSTATTAMTPGNSNKESSATSNTTNATVATPSHGSLSSSLSSSTANQQPKDLVSSFTIVIAMVSRKAMLDIQKDFVYKCMLAGRGSNTVSSPGEDPIAAAMGLRDRIPGVCKNSLKRVLEVAGNTLISQEKRFRYVTIEIGKMMKVLETHSSKSSTTLAGNLTGTSTPSAVTATTTANSGATGSVVQVPDLNRQFSTDVMRSISVDELDDLHNNDAPHSPTPNASSTIAVVEFGRSRRSSSNSAQPAFTSEGITVNVPEDTGSVNNIQDSINASAVDAEVSAAFIDSSTGLQLSGLDDAMVPSTLAMKKLKSHSSTPLTPTAAGALSTSNCTTVTTTCANSNHSPTRHLCHHLLLESLFANELKTLFHCVTSCHAANVQFNCLATSTSQSKAVNVPLLCKDMKHCEDSCNLMTMVQSTMNSKRGLGGYGSAQTVFRPPVLNQILTFNSSLASRSSAGASIGLGLAASTSGTALATMENNLLMSAVAASNTNNDNANSQQNSKFKGINLSTQTILMMADRDTILRTLLILDNTLAIPSSRNASLGGTTAVTSSSQGASTNPLIATVATANNRLYTFVEAADPTQSFIDLSLQLDEPVEELISMAHYLQGWGLAEVIPLIYSESIYMVHPSANVKILINERVNKAFEALIGSFDLSSSASSSSSNITQLLNGSSSAALPPGFSRHRSGSYGSSYHSMKDLSLPSNNTATWSGNKRNPALHSSSHGNSQSLLSSSLDNHSPLMTVFEDGYANSSISPPPNVAMQPSQSNIGLDLMSPISTEPQSTTAPPPKELLLDQQSESDLKYYALSRILSLFNGSRTIHEILANHIPSPLREYIIDIIVFLLQWHLLLPVHHYIVNLLANPATAAEFYAQQAPSNTDQSPSHVAQSKVSTASHPTSSAARHPQRRRSTSGDVGYYLSESEMSLDIEKHMDALNINKSNLTNNMEYANQQANNTFLNNVFTNTLSSDEHSTYEKMAMYLQGNYQSSKTVEEILWLCKVTERDLQKVLKKLPYLQKIKKVY